jgi:hypothetical protein
MHTILRLPDVKRSTGLSRSTIYLRIAQGTFPKPVSLGGRAPWAGWKPKSNSGYSDELKRAAPEIIEEVRRILREHVRLRVRCAVAQARSRARQVLDKT